MKLGGWATADRAPPPRIAIASIATSRSLEPAVMTLLPSGPACQAYRGAAPPRSLPAVPASRRRAGPNVHRRRGRTVDPESAPHRTEARVQAASAPLPSSWQRGCHRPGARTTGSTLSPHPKLFGEPPPSRPGRGSVRPVIQSGLTALLERDRDLAELDGLVEDACAGRGRLVLIEGAPGIGKTRLLEATRARAGERGMVVLSARASELDREFPLGVVRQLFEPLIAGADAARRATLLSGAASLAAPLLGLGASPAGVAAPDRDQALAHFHALYWLAANLAEETPVALVIDDVHWADATSLQFVQFLSPRLDGLPMLVAVAARPPEAGVERGSIDAILTHVGTLVLRPAPLTDRAVAELIADALGEPAQPTFLDACQKATGGNPFLLRELLRELSSEGVAPGAAQVSLVRQLAPPTVARAVVLRLGRLGDEAAALARAVAVLGDGSPLHRAAALAGLSEERADELAATLAQADILAAVRPLTFAHPILRTAVYADIDGAECARAHRKAAALVADEG